MNVGLATDVAHPIGFLAGSAVYALLLAMVLQATGGVGFLDRRVERRLHQRIRLPLYIAILGLIWNLGSLAAFLTSELSGVVEPSGLTLLAISALGTLPAVAIHSIWQTTHGAARRLVGMLTATGYGFSLTAVAWNALTALSGDPVPAPSAWWLLTAGYLVLFAGLLWATRRTLAWHGGLLLVFLAVCSIVALPLSRHPDGSLPWWLDFFEHHASLPVAIAVLYRDYRFVFVDHFMKRACSFLLLVGLSFTLYMTVMLPVFQTADGLRVSPALSGLVVSLWVLTALAYPWVHRTVTWAFDVLLLHRPDYHGLRRQLTQRINEQKTADLVLDEICRSLQQALPSKAIHWKSADRTDHPGMDKDTITKIERPLREDQTGSIYTAEGGLVTPIPTVEPPRFMLAIAPLKGGRRFLSEDVLLVDAAALAASRRIDALRTSHERCELALREQEMQKLVTEAELQALRAQVNPHFLFNALNTIAYLIEIAPQRATETLKHLTDLLRGVLRRMEGGFTTLGEEMELIRSYLDIEQARFEERLTVRIDVPEHVMGVQVPALVLQPIVENAVKHGIQPALNGGMITIAVRTRSDLNRHRGNGSAVEQLTLEVCDTGAGVTSEQLRRGRQNGIGLKNVERRLRCYYGARASIHVISEPGAGTTVIIRLPSDASVSDGAVPIVSMPTNGESR